MWYYAGLASCPKLVYRTGKKAWIKPTGPEAYRELKEVRPVFGHKLNVVWPDLGSKVRWTSIDVARFIIVGDGEVAGPPVLWIGVHPDTLEGEDAFNAANDLLTHLATFDITDVEIEYRESVYTRSAGPPLLRSVSNLNTTVDVCGPVTLALGLPIATATRPDAQGTMALYFTEGGDSTKVLGLTCRHVLFEMTEDANDDYVLTGAGTPRKNVQLLGTREFKKLLDSIKMRIGRHGIMVEIYEGQIAKVEAEDDWRRRERRCEGEGGAGGD